GDFQGDLLAAQAAVHVGPQADGGRAAGEVADVLDVADDVGEGGAALAVLGGGEQELVVEVDADHAAAGDDRADHVVAELAVGGYDPAAVGVRRHYRAGGQVVELPERFLGQVGRVVDDAQPVHLADQLDALGRERPGRAGPAGVARPLPRQPDDPHAHVEPRVKVGPVADRV